jgi:hypothetical protein
MATPRKRPSSGFSEKPAEENTEEQEIEESLEVTVADVLEEIETIEKLFPEITPTEDPGPRFVETLVEETQPEPQKAQVKKPKRHPRNIPRFSRTVK